MKLYHGSQVKDFIPTFGLGNDGYAFKPGEPLDGLSADWIGQFYAYAQWQWGIPSGELVDRIPIRAMRIAYPGLHDLDLGLAVEKVSQGVS